MHSVLTAYLLLVSTVTAGGFETGLREQSRKPPKLTATAIQSLVAAQAPDNVIAGEIEERGLAFVPNPGFLEDLRSQGAGPKTLDLLSLLLPRGSLTIETLLSGCDVLIDGQTLGRTDSDGNFIVSNLPVRNYTIVLRKLGYREFKKDIVLTAAGATLKAHLTPDIGLVNVTTDAPDATLSIPGYGQFHEDIHELMLPSGTYTVSATSPGHRPVQHALTVRPGYVRTLTLHLEPIISELVVTMLGSLENKQFARAEQQADELLRYMPDNGYGYLTKATVSYYRGDREDFAKNVRRTIKGGIPMPFIYTHIAKHGEHHVDKLELGDTYLKITPAISCDLPTFTYLPRALVDVKVATDKNGTLVLQVRLYVPLHGRVKAEFIDTQHIPGALTNEDEFNVLRILLEEARAGQLALAK
jgi:hypothetical protein